MNLKNGRGPFRPETEAGKLLIKLNQTYHCS